MFCVSSWIMNLFTSKSEDCIGRCSSGRSHWPWASSRKASTHFILQESPTDDESNIVIRQTAESTSPHTHTQPQSNLIPVYSVKISTNSFTVEIIWNFFLKNQTHVHNSFRTSKSSLSSGKKNSWKKLMRETTGWAFWKIASLRPEISCASGENVMRSRRAPNWGIFFFFSSTLRETK